MGASVPYEFDQCGAGDLRGERLAERLEVFLLGLAAAGGVGADRRPAEVGERREPGQHRGEGDLESGAVGLVLGVGGDEPLGRLGAGVPAAQR